MKKINIEMITINTKYLISFKHYILVGESTPTISIPDLITFAIALRKINLSGEYFFDHL